MPRMVFWHRKARLFSEAIRIRARAHFDCRSAKKQDTSRKISCSRAKGVRELCILPNRVDLDRRRDLGAFPRVLARHLSPLTKFRVQNLFHRASGCKESNGELHKDKNRRGEWSYLFSARRST